MDDKTRTELEAAAFRRLVSHLQERTDVQNIDLMNLAGFCRNCLSRWYREEAGSRGIEIADPKAREIVYGMPYEDWKAKHQKEASGDQKKAFDKASTRAQAFLGVFRGQVPVIPIIHRPRVSLSSTWSPLLWSGRRDQGVADMPDGSAVSKKTKAGPVSADRLKSFVERIEKLEEERQAPSAVTSRTSIARPRA